MTGFNIPTKMKFKLKSKFKPAGDQPGAINKLYKGLKKGNKYQTLLGVTGSGKTFTMANVIEKKSKTQKFLGFEIWNWFGII